jgi:hypothetical protein
MTYDCSARGVRGGEPLLKLQRLQNKILRTSGKFPRCALTRELQAAFEILCVYDFVTKLCRQQTDVTQNHENINISNTAQGEAQLRKHDSKLVAVKRTAIRVSKLSLKL